MRLTSSSSSQKSKLSYRLHNFDRILKLAFRAFCDKSQDINSSTCIRADSFMNSISVSSSISSKSSTFKKHALRHINKVSNESTSLLIHQEISRSQRVTKRKSYHLSSRDSSFKNAWSAMSLKIFLRFELLMFETWHRFWSWSMSSSCF